MEKFVNAFNSAAAEGVMCRTLLSVGWDGRLYDCDLNQMLEIQLGGPGTVFNYDFQKLMNRRILFASHCFGCTAGAGSNCRGTIV